MPKFNMGGMVQAFAQGGGVKESSSSLKGNSIVFSPTINIQGVMKTPEQLAKEIVRPLKAEIRRLSGLGVYA
jgi:hypothetical protein